MGQYNTAVLTTAGQSLLASVLGTEGTLTFSKFQTSSYQYASGTDLSALTSLQNVEQEILPSAGGIKDATTLYSSSTISNEGVTAEYDCNTVGLFATDGEDEVLFAVSTAIIPDVIPVDDGGAPSTYTYTMSIGVSSTANITVEVDDQGILRVSSIVDNLNSTSATAPLSANQGNVIAKDMVENILSGNTNTTGDILATGSYFINNTGQLCRVTTDIPVDGAITLNTNCVAVNVGGELTELNSKIDANNIGNSIDISAIILSDEMYTFPSDGYLTVVTHNQDLAQLYIWGANNTMAGYMFVPSDVNAYSGQSLYVKAGMKVSKATLVISSQDSIVNFKPLIN